MNSLRLVFGWLFLTALTAAGTYYAMDEIDQRVGLARFNLHEKLGITRYAAAPKPILVTPTPTPIVVTPTPTPIKPADYTDPPTGIIPPHVPGGDGPPPPILAPGRGTPAAVIPSIPARGYPTPSVPSRPTPSYPPPGPAPGPAPASVPFIRPKDFNEVNDRLIDVKSRADAVAGHWAGIESSLRSMNQPLRPQIKSALSSLKQNVATADQALRAGDTASARHYVEQAEKQLDILHQYDE
jgi:hypothetical protein